MCAIVTVINRILLSEAVKLFLLNHPLNAVTIAYKRLNKTNQRNKEWKTSKPEYIVTSEANMTAIKL